MRAAEARVRRYVKGKRILAGRSKKIGHLPRRRNRVKECRRACNNHHAETEEEQ